MLTTVAFVLLLFLFCILFIPESKTVHIHLGKLINADLPLAMVFVPIAGLCTSVMWGSIFNLAAEGLGKYTPMASGIFMALVCGGGILPFLQNSLADATNLITSYWVPVIGVCYILFFALIGSKNVNKDIPVE